MPKIEKYCFIEIPGATYILHTQEPSLIGRVWLYKSLPELEYQIEKISPMGYVQMETHSIAITLWDVLGKFTPLIGNSFIHSGVMQEIAPLMEGMLNFYIIARKVNTSAFYNKFKI